MRGPAPTIPALLLDAYRRGAFPMARQGPGGKVVRGKAGIDFYSCDPRAVVPLEAGVLHWPRSLRAVVRKNEFRITCDKAFASVIRACAAVPWRRDGNWINDWIIRQYALLHRLGHAHSVEAWARHNATDVPARVPGPFARAGWRLVGGLYGVHIGGAFFGESMFSRPDLGGDNASKVCFVRLVEHLQRRGFALLDSQMNNPHMRSLGAIDVPLAHYHALLAAAVDLPVTWGRFEPGR